MSAKSTDGTTGAGQPPCHAGRPSAVVIQFPTRQYSGNRLALRDRIVLLEWVEAARSVGIGRAVTEHWESGDDASVVGDFVMIYRDGLEWATWAVARSNGRYHLWEMAYGQTLAVFDSLSGALACVSDLAVTAKPSSMPRRHTARPRPQRTGSAHGAAAAAGRTVAIR